MKVRREDGLKDTIVDAPTWWGLANGGFMREDAIWNNGMTLRGEGLHKGVIRGGLISYKNVL